ncbi:MAG: ThuA domain-containing protein [Burkholderiaceae bacterium]
MTSLRPTLLLACILLCLAPVCDGHAFRKIVLIGGAKSEGPARHDYPDGARLLKAFLESSPDANAGADLRVDAYPDGWPADPAALAGAATIVWYFDGMDKHPLLDAGRRARFDALMRQGAGLVVLHQASTVPIDDDLDLPRWLGAARHGLFDRTTESARLVPAAHSHPTTRGVQAFEYRDEFYPTLGFKAGGGRLVPVLEATLHTQYRNGVHLNAATPETSTVAWAFERDDGGRSFGFTGAHYLVALDEPMVTKMLLNAIFWTAGIDVPAGGVRSGLPDAATRVARAAMSAAPSKWAVAYADAPTFHRDPQRTGWHSTETVLTPAKISGSAFGLLWESPQFDAFEGEPARLYASPLYVDRVELSAGGHKGATFPILFAASNNGFVYAVNAAQVGDVAPGRILWRTQLAPPCRLQPAPLDGVPTGVLATPVIDVSRSRLYVTQCDPERRWQAYALDITNGEVLPGWPVRLDEASFNAVNRNAGPAPVAPTRRFDFRVQRGALNLSPDGTRLYVTFGETETGWIVAVDTVKARVGSAFASLAMPHRGSGGIWGAGGTAVDASGTVFAVTGSGFNGLADQANDWAQSVLELSDSASSGFALRGTYTPFNYCQTAAMDIDLGSGGVTLLPDLDPAITATPRLAVVGGKQGNAYLLDRARLPGRLDKRQSCGTDAASDASLLPPQDQPQFGKRGPLNVFGPYSEKDGALEQARARSVPAYFRDASGNHYVFVTGNTQKVEGSSVGIAPSLVRLKVVTEPGRPAYLHVDGQQMSEAFANPGSPVVTSNGTQDGIVWVLDENARRFALLSGADAPRPMLYAFDAITLELLWKSAPWQLFTSGKYNEPAFARGNVFVGTDRIQAFGIGQPLPSRRVELQQEGTQASAAETARASPPNTRPRIASGRADGKAIYASRCAACHDHPQGSIPPRELIAARPCTDIVHALADGAMRAQAEGLRGDEIEAVARYLKQ